MIITRKVEFSASHVCRIARLTEEENRRIYGAAANPNGHGHNYVVEVSVAGRPDPVTGMVLDLKELKALLNREVVEPYDHRFLNYEAPPFDQVTPTTENIAREIWRRLEPHLRGEERHLHSIRLYETPDLFVDYFGEHAGENPSRITSLFIDEETPSAGPAPRTLASGRPESLSHRPPDPDSTEVPCSA